MATLQEQIAKAQKRVERAVKLGDTKLKQRNLALIQKLRLREPGTLQVEEKKQFSPDLPPGVVAGPKRGRIIKKKEEKGVSQEIPPPKEISPPAEEIPPVNQIEPEDTRTQAEIAESLVGADLLAQRAAEEKFFGEAETPSTLEEFVGDFTETQAAEKERFDTQAEAAQTASEQQAAEAKNRLEQIQGVTEAQLRGGREGPESATADVAAGKLRTAMTQRIDRLIAQQDATRADIAASRQQLERAQSEGRTQLATQLQSAIDAKEVELENMETDRINALTQASEEERAQQTLRRQSLEMFTGLVDSGIEMTPDSIRSMSNQLGIDFETAFGYFEGAERIRQDKSLDTAAKEVEFANLNKDFQERLAGLSTKEAKSVNDFLQLSQSGQYSAEELQAFAISMDIPNENNPVFQADLAIKQAELKIKTAIANGELLNPLDQQRLIEARYTNAQLTGNGLGSVPTGGKYTAKNIDFTADQLMADYGYKSDTQISGVRADVEPGDKFARGQCGAWINDFLGTSVGDGIQTKMDQTDPSIIVPEAGMFFVEPGGYDLDPGTPGVQDSGHIGMIEWVDPVNGMMGVVESNKLGDERIGRRVIPIPPVSKTSGFGRPPNGVPIQGAGGETSDNVFNEFLTQAKDLGLSGEKATEFAEKRLEESFAKLTGEQGKASKAFLTSTAENESYDALVADIDPEKFADRINMITKNISDPEATMSAEVINRALGTGKKNSTIRAALMSEMRWLQAVLREESGAAISVSEFTSKGAAFFPRAGDDAATIEAKRAARKREADGLRIKMGPSGVRQILELQQGAEPQSTPIADVDTAALAQQAIEQAERQSFAQDDDDLDQFNFSN